VKKERSDILTRSDVELMVNSFYDKVKGDELLSPVFANVDWPDHLPVMYNFWSSMLLGDMSYSGNAMGKHLALSIKRNHFTRWLELFIATVDEHFEGYNATEAKNRAQSIAALFQHKMGLME
jgi:hemoglobin